MKSEMYKVHIELGELKILLEEFKTFDNAWVYYMKERMRRSVHSEGIRITLGSDARGELRSFEYTALGGTV